jgi:hypothetical protein
MGRLMVINRQQGMASNYDCCICPCPMSHSPAYDYVSPASSNMVVGGSVGLVYYAGYVDCNYYTYEYNESSVASWSSAHPNIATVNSSGRVTGQSGGSSSIGGQYSDYTYYSNPYLPPYCFVALLAVGSGSGGANVLPHITSISPSRGLIGATTSVTINGSGFGTSATVNAGSGTTVTTSSVSDTQISASFQVASNAPSGNHSVTVSTAQGTSNSVNFYVQVPTSLQVLNHFVISMTYIGSPCNDTSSYYGIDIAAQYQILDQNGQPINSSNMEPQEEVLNVVDNGQSQGNPEPNWGDIGPTNFPGTSKYTNSYGQFYDAPFGTCSNAPVVLTQTQKIGILLSGSVFPVRTSNWTISSSSGGHGSVSNGTDISNTR